MKNIFKLLFVFMIFFFLNNVSALETDISETCTVEEKIALNSLANHVTIDFEFNENDEKFNLLFENITPYISVEYGNNTYKYSSKGTIIRGFDEGKRLSFNIVASEYSECYGYKIKSIQYMTPYINRFLESSECNENPTAEICKTKFTDYKLTYSLLKNMLKKNTKQEKKIEEKEIERIYTWKDNLLDFLDKYGMQVGLFLLGSITTIILGHGAVIRAKTKF